MSGTSTTPVPAPQYVQIDENDRLIERDVKSNKWDPSGKPVVYSNPAAMYLRTSVNQRFEITANMPATNIVNAQLTQIEIPKGFGNGIYEQAFLQLNFTETSGVNSVQLAPAPYILSNNNGVALAFNSGGTLAWTTNADAIYASLQAYSNEKITQMFAFNQMNMSATTFASPTSIPAGGSATYVIPLTALPLLGMAPKMIGSSTFLQVNFNNQGAVVAGTGTATLTSCKLILTAHRNDLLDQKKNVKIANGVYTNSVCRWLNITVPQNLALGYNLVPLSGLVNTYAGALCVMLRSTKTGAGIYAFSSISGNTSPHTATIDVLSSNGLSILGSGGGVTEAFMRSQSQWIESPSIMSTIVPLNWIYLSARPAEFMLTGSSSAGGMPLGPNQNLVITPSGSFAPGADIIDVYVLARQTLRQTNGFVEVLQ